MAEVLVETMARAIWEAQRAKVKTSISKSRTWNDNSVPAIFWEGYRDDARAALSVLPDFIKSAG